MENYEEELREYLDNPEAFWTERTKQFTWFEPWRRLHNHNSNPLDWFVGGKINLSYETLDKHVDAGHGDNLAIVCDSPFTKSVVRYTYKELLDKVSRVTGLLSECGVKHGDHVMINMPMIAENLIAVLASARLGALYTAVHTIKPEEAMVQRMDDFKAKVIVTTNCEFDSDGAPFNTKRYLDAVLRQCDHKPRKCIVLQRDCAVPATLLSPRDIDWNDALHRATPHGPIPVECNQPVFVIYTSGTTSKPKGVMISARNVMSSFFQAKAILGTSKNSERHMFYAASFYVWIVGQLAACYIPLKERSPFLLWEKSLSDADVKEFYHLLAEYGITSSFVNTAVLRRLTKQDQNGDIAALYQSRFKIHQLMVGGVPGDDATIEWVRKHLRVSPVQVYGMTEIGFITNADLSNGHRHSDQPMMASGKPYPGIRVKILRDEDNGKLEEARVGETGRIVIQLPTPSIPCGYLNDVDNQKFINHHLTTFPGYFETHDDGKFDADGQLYVLNRSDNQFKIAGNRITCEALEDAIMLHPDVGECVVVTKTTNDLEELPVIFFVLNEGCKQKPLEYVKRELKGLVAKKIGNWIPVNDLACTESIPKGFTGKVDRGTVQAMVRNRYSQAIKDPILQNFWTVVQNRNN